jgi:hypothetical protein
MGSLSDASEIFSNASFAVVDADDSSTAAVDGPDGHAAIDAVIFVESAVGFVGEYFVGFAVFVATLVVQVASGNGVSVLSTTLVEN